MKRGDVYWANLKPRSGSEQTGHRPVVIVSHDSFNRIPNWQSIIVVPLSTSSTQARRGPTAIPITKEEANLTKEGVALCHQVTTLDRNKLDTLIGTLSHAVLKEIEDGLKAAMNIL
jgi:mRNA interferase MazF